MADAPATNLTPEQFTAATGQAPTPTLTQAQLDAQNASRGISQATPAPTAGNGLPIGGGGDGNQQPGATPSPYYSRITDTPSTVPAPAPQSAEEIQAAKTKAAQGEIDALNSYYADQTAQQKTVNDKNDRSTSAISTLTGLAGSTEADVVQQDTSAKGQQATAKIQHEQALAIQSILGKIRDDSVTEARQQRLDYNQSVTDTIANRAAQKAAAIDNIKSLTAAGVTADGLKASDPTSYAHLLDKYDGDAAALKGAFILNTPKDQILDHQIQNGKYVIARQNPLTDKVTIETHDLGIPPGYSKVVDAGDRMVAVPDNWDGDTSKLLSINKGLTPKDKADLSGAGGGNLTGPNAGVIQTILGSGKFTKEQSAAVTRAINNGEDPGTVIKNQAKNIMGQTEATTVTKYETAKNSLQDIQKNLNDFYAAGGKTSLLNGTYEKVINNLGSVNDPKLVDLATQIQANLQVYRNAVSGTAYSAQEGADISSIFPGINKSQGLNTAILKGRMTAFDSTIDGTYRSTLGSAYDKLKAAESATKDGGGGTPAPQEFTDAASAPVGATVKIGGKDYKKSGPDSYDPL